MLARLAGSAQAPNAGEAADIGHALDHLTAREALPGDEERRWRARLAASGQELAALRARLAALDGPRSLPEGTAGLLDRYEALAGFHDPQAAAWRRRFEEVRVLLGRLAPLIVRPPPEQAAADLGRLAGLVGSDDPQVAAWRHKLAAIAELRGRLGATLTGLGELPPGTDAALAELAGLVGETDPDLRDWTTRRDKQRDLIATLDGWEQRVVLPAEAVGGARAALARYRVLAGDDARSVRAERRLGRPARTTASAVGRRCRPRPSRSLGRTEPRRRPPTSALAAAADLHPRQPGRRTRPRGRERPAVRVRLTRGLWVADRECPQGLWQAAMGGNPSRRQDAGLPVESVSAAEAEAFCVRLQPWCQTAPSACPQRPSGRERCAPAPKGHGERSEMAQVAVAIVHRTRGSAGHAPPAAGSPIRSGSSTAPATSGSGAPAPTARRRPAPWSRIRCRRPGPGGWRAAARGATRCPPAAWPTAPPSPKT